MLPAWMVELVDTRDLKSLSFGSVGSSPTPGTTNLSIMDNILSTTLVDTFMTKEVQSVKKAETIKNLLDLMGKNGILGAPVVDDENQVIGIVTESDLIKHFTTLENPAGIPLLGSLVSLGADEFNQQLLEHCAETIEALMTSPVITIHGDATLLEAVDLMSKEKVNRLPVVEGEGRLVGIITRTDIVQELAKITTP